MANSSRRKFLKNVSQKALAAGLSLSLPRGAKANETEGEKKEKLPWPYPVAYGKENEVEADVLVLGGGVAGSHAAINAAKRGAKVVVVEKGTAIRSGSGGAGVDHWHGACTNPCSKITPEEMMEIEHAQYRSTLFPGYFNPEYGNAIRAYIAFKESYDTLLDVEKMGVKVRDVDDEFKGAPFRDEKTKLTFAYDYENRYSIRVIGGANIKVALFNEMERLGVKIYNRVMATSLLTENGEQGGRVIGATGLNSRTGEFYIFKSRATILSTSAAEGLWVFSTELNGGSTHGDPNNAGEATAMAWQAGAEMTVMERSGHHAAGGFAFPTYGTGSWGNTWFACNIVDANGKQIPYVDRDGNILKTVLERYTPGPGQKVVFPDGNPPYEYVGAKLLPGLDKRILSGEYELPLYADFPSMTPHERRALWGCMIYNEGKGRIVYDTYQNAGFDPEKDMLQVCMMPPDEYVKHSWTAYYGPRQWREAGFNNGAGPVFDWDLKTSLDGLYVAGQSGYSGGNHVSAATSGRYAGRKAVAYARTVQPSPVSRGQIEKEKDRVYAPVRRTEGIGWKELRAGLARIMQDYLGEYRTEKTLRMGLYWFESIKESEAASVVARNPHELMRAVECMTRLTIGEVMIHASLNRKASSAFLEFKRTDYPEKDPEEWNKLVTMRLKKGKIELGELPLDYYLKPPYAASYEENYRKHCEL